MTLQNCTSFIKNVFENVQLTAAPKVPVAVSLASLFAKMVLRFLVDASPIVKRGFLEAGGVALGPDGDVPPLALDDFFREASPDFLPPSSAEPPES